MDNQNSDMEDFEDPKNKGKSTFKNSHKNRGDSGEASRKSPSELETQQKGILNSKHVYTLYVVVYEIIYLHMNVIIYKFSFFQIGILGVIRTLTWTSLKIRGIKGNPPPKNSVKKGGTPKKL